MYRRFCSLQGLARERCSVFCMSKRNSTALSLCSPGLAALQCATCRLQPCSLQPYSLQPATLQPAASQLAALQPAALQPAACNPARLCLAVPNLTPAILQPCSLQPCTCSLRLLRPGSAALAGGLEITESVYPGSLATQHRCVAIDAALAQSVRQPAPPPPPLASPIGMPLLSTHQHVTGRSNQQDLATDCIQYSSQTEVPAHTRQNLSSSTGPDGPVHMRALEGTPSSLELFCDQLTPSSTCLQP